jgi:hypothetical protein
MSLLRKAERLVGQQHVDGSFDCAHLAVQAQREIFGREVRLPYGTAPHPMGRLGQMAAISSLRDVLADHVADGDTGDAVLFAQQTPQGKRWHIGTLIVEAGDVWVLHTHGGAGASVLERLRELAPRGLRVEGYYRWRNA